MNLRVKDNVYYSIPNILNNMIDLDGVDVDFILSMIDFLVEELGLRTSPMMLLGYVLNLYVKMRIFSYDEEIESKSKDIEVDGNF